MIPVEEITTDYIRKHGIDTSNIIVHEKVPEEGHKIFLDKFYAKKGEPPIKIAENISYVHLYGVHPSIPKDDILPIAIIDRGVIYVTTHVFYQIEEKEGRKDLKLYISI